MGVARMYAAGTLAVGFVVNRLQKPGDRGPVSLLEHVLLELSAARFGNAGSDVDDVIARIVSASTRAISPPSAPGALRLGPGIGGGSASATRRGAKLP